MTEWAGVKREAEFYAVARQDGLLKREELMGTKVMDHFTGRKDGMYYRSATLSEDRTGTANMLWVLPPGGIRGGSYDLVAHKMAIKYEKLNSLTPTTNFDKGKRQVAKRSFYLSEYRIRTQYHLQPGQVQADEETTYTDRRGGSGLSSSSSSAASPGGAPSSTEDNSALVTAEKECLTAVKNAQSEMNELVLQRRREESVSGVLFEEPIFDAAPKRLQALQMQQDEINNENANGDNTATSHHHAGGGDGRHGHHKRSGNQTGNSASSRDINAALLTSQQQPNVDYLTPFLTGLKDGPTSRLSREEAQRVRESCLRSLKERLLERANIIQNRLNDENVKLSKRQATFQRNASRDVDPAAEEDFERFCADAMFTIGILEQRLVAHEESALKKYQALDEKLSKDPRLSALLT